MARESDRRVNETREKMRLLLAASALFVLLAGLTLVIILVLWKDEQNAARIAAVFSPFFLVGITLLVASAFLKIDEAKELLHAGRGG